jgi:hypothetical protein
MREEHSTTGHFRMARGDHGLPKISLGHAMPFPIYALHRTLPETALWPLQGRPAHRAGGLRPSSTPLDTPRRTSMQDHSREEEFRRRMRISGNNEGNSFTKLGVRFKIVSS